MGTLRFLLEKEFRQFIRNSFMPKMVVMFPLVVMLVMPLVTTMDIRHIGVAVVDRDHSEASRRLTEKIAASDYFSLQQVTADYASALLLLEEGEVDVILDIPDRFDRSLTTSTPRKVSIAANGVNAIKGSFGAQYLTQVVAQTFTELRSEQGLPQVADAVVVQNRYNPTLDYQWFMIPALMIMLIVMLCGFLPALNLVGEKETGTIEQINVTPVGRFTFTLAKLIPFWVIGFVVLTLAMMIAWAVYGLTPAGNVGAIYLAAALFILSMSGIGGDCCQSFFYDAAGYVCDVLFCDGFCVDERTDYPGGIYARLGTNGYSFYSSPLFCGCYAFRLPERDKRCGVVDGLFCPVRFCRGA